MMAEAQLFTPGTHKGQYAIYVLARDLWHTPWWISRQHLMTRLAKRGWSIVYTIGLNLNDIERRRKL